MPRTATSRHLTNTINCPGRRFFLSFAHRIPFHQAWEPGFIQL